MPLIEVWGNRFCLFVKLIAFMRLLTKGYRFTKMAKLVFLLLFSQQTGLFSKPTNSHLKPVVFHAQGEVCFPEPSKGLKVNKKKPLWKLPAWLGGCQPLAEPRGAAGLRTAAGEELAGAGLTSTVSWQAGTLLTGAGWAASRESLFRNEGRVNKCLLLEQENLWNGDVEWHSLTPVQQCSTH